MKPNHRNPLLLPAITLASLAFGASASFAADLTWDTASGDGATVTAGIGSWNLTAGNTVWNNAGSNVIWSQTSTTDASNAAIFAGADGTLNQYVVTLGAQMAAESITFNSSGYQISGSTLALIVSPTAPISNGAITVAAGKTATINSILRYAHNNTANVSVGSGGVLNLGGGTTASNNPQWQLSGAGAINLTGGTYTNNIGNFNTAAINLTGGTHAITPGNSAAANIGNAAGQNVNYTVSGTGTLTVNNNASSGTGTGFSALRLGFGDTGVNEAKLTVQTGGTVSIGNGKYGELQISGSATSNGKLDVQGGTVTISAGVPAANKIYFFKSGSNSGYTSVMTQSGGTVTANGIQFGSDTGTYDAASSATLTLSGGSLYVGAEGMTRGSAASTLPVTIQLQSGTLGASANWSSSLDMKLGVATIQAATSGAAARNITLSGVLSNDGASNGSITKTGAGTLFLNNDSNTFSGQILSDSGILQVTKLANAGTASSLGSGAAANVIRLGNNATATIEYVGTTDSGTNRPIQIGTNNAINTGSASILNNSTSGKLTFNGSSFNPAVTGVTVARTLTLGGSNTMDNTISGQIVDNGGVGGTISVVKQDAGKWILSGSNAYTGATNVTAGTLVVDGSLANTTTMVGSAATLQGSGSIGGSVTIQDGGTLAAGNSIESLGIGALSLEANSTFAYELQTNLYGGTPDVAGDLTYSTGTIDISAGTILTLTDLATSTALAAGSKLTLISYFGGWTSTELFTYNDNTLADDSTFTLGANQWRFNYNDTTGGLNYTGDQAGATSFVTMTVIPEPGAAFLGGLGLVVLLRRRRH